MRALESFSVFMISLGLVIVFYFNAEAFRRLMIFFGNQGSTINAWLSAGAWLTCTGAALASLALAWCMWRRGPGQ